MACLLSFFKNVSGAVRVATTAWTSGVDLEAIAAGILKYGPLFVALIEAIEQDQSDEEHAEKATALERGFHAITETQDTTLAENAVRALVTKRGVRL